MVSRLRKLSAAGVVLAVGLCLAWPLRLSDEAAPVAGGVTRLPPLPTERPATSYSGLHLENGAVPPANRGVAVIGISAHAHGETDREPPTTGDSRPLLSALPEAGPESPASGERIHVVHEGDRLDRLAKRYLGDEGRAVEIFDLNRTVLVNPHLLPIGLELRIPARSGAVDP